MISRQSESAEQFAYYSIQTLYIIGLYDSYD